MTENTIFFYRVRSCYLGEGRWWGLVGDISCDGVVALVRILFGAGKPPSPGQWSATRGVSEPDLQG